MYISRAASSRFICNACRRLPSVSTKPSGNPFAPSAALKSAGSFTKSTKCAFSTSSPAFKEGMVPTAEDPEHTFLDSATKTLPSKDTPPSTSIDASIEATPIEETAASSTDASIPWYLRQSTFGRDVVQNPIDIPDLPPNPPPLLKTLLEYITITAGLDDIQMLDLRDLDPPPALGPKLIMIIATARSEKHLHVAADRFSRYMRREHGLRANAAGLLGRNELKIKLRRKAKRMRMLANVGGAVPEGNIDDGIRTGWICCTLSKIEAHPDDMHMPGDNVQEFVGFRDVKPGVNVVVQMFTEEKRAETDLEALWGGVVKTHQRKDQAADDKLRELEDPEDIQAITPEVAETSPRPKHESSEVLDTTDDLPTTLPTQQFRRPKPTAGDSFPSDDFKPARQIRRLHTVGLR